MKKFFPFILIVFLISCNRSSHLLPDKYSIKQELKFDTALNYGRILKIENSEIDIEDLKNYPLTYKKNLLRKEEKVLVTWTQLDKLEGKDAIISGIRQILDFGENEHVIKLLKKLESDSQKIYFAGLGREMLGLNNTKHNFYQFKYFMDTESNEIYEFDDIH